MIKNPNLLQEFKAKHSSAVLRFLKLRNAPDDLSATEAFRLEVALIESLEVLDKWVNDFFHANANENNAETMNDYFNRWPMLELFTHLADHSERGLLFNLFEKGHPYYSALDERFKWVDIDFDFGRR